jgi:hypothetical protein
MVKTRIKCLLLLMIVVINAHTQSLTRSVISVTGNTSIENNGVLSYSAGETITGSVGCITGDLTQGFQQPSLLYLKDDNSQEGINAVEVFPNPVIKNLTILFTIRTSKVLHVDMVSGNGIIYKTEQFNVSESGKIVIEMGDFPCGLFLFHIYSTEKVIDRVFKIEKI